MSVWHYCSEILLYLLVFTFHINIKEPSGCSIEIIPKKCINLDKLRNIHTATNLCLPCTQTYDLRLLLRSHWLLLNIQFFKKYASSFHFRRKKRDYISSDTPFVLFWITVRGEFLFHSLIPLSLHYWLMSFGSFSPRFPGSFELMGDVIFLSHAERTVFLIGAV